MALENRSWYPARLQSATALTFSKALVKVFDQHDVAFERIDTGVDNRATIGRNIKAGRGIGGRAGVHHAEASLLVRG